MAEGKEEIDGVVTELLPNSIYRVKLESGQSVLAHLASGTRMQLVRVLPGDQVTLELSPYDPGRGRIVRRGGERPGR
ncbi:translation initiation factor IF-1 [bacterium CPR1]|nr:translation initiation factor IF-1 [bacterium CPR1]